MPERYTITLSAEECDLIGKALGKLPLEETLNLYARLKVEILNQQKGFANSAESTSPQEPSPPA